MTNTKAGIPRLIISALCSITVILYSGYNYFFPNKDIYVSEPSDIILPFEPNVHCTESSDSSVLTEFSQSTQDPVFPTDESKPVSIPVQAGQKVLGEVVSKFITPYTANTSFGKVYIKNSTNLKIDIKELLSSSLPYRISKNSSPQVLIVHTHTTEAFMHEDRNYYTDKDLPRTKDINYSVVRLGNILTEKLNSAGIKTVHDTTLHDYPVYNGSYDRAAVTINKNLKKYKDIKVVIDLHRDAIGGGESPKVKPITKINGKKAAQVMLVMGSQSGYVKNFPKWKENLKLAVRLQQNIETMYPTLARALSFMPRLYNENLTQGSMLLEIGTDSNSIDEAVYSAELVADALIKTLNSLQ